MENIELRAPCHGIGDGFPADVKLLGREGSAQLVDLVRRESDDDVDIVRESVSYTHLTLPTIILPCRSRWSPYH